MISQARAAVFCLQSHWAVMHVMALYHGLSFWWRWTPFFPFRFLVHCWQITAKGFDFSPDCLSTPCCIVAFPRAVADQQLALSKAQAMLCLVSLLHTAIWSTPRQNVSGLSTELSWVQGLLPAAAHCLSLRNHLAGRLRLGVW